MVILWGGLRWCIGIQWRLQDTLRVQQEGLDIHLLPGAIHVWVPIRRLMVLGMGIHRGTDGCV